MIDDINWTWTEEAEDTRVTWCSGIVVRVEETEFLRTRVSPFGVVVEPVGIEDESRSVWSYLLGNVKEKPIQ